MSEGRMELQLDDALEVFFRRVQMTEIRGQKVDRVELMIECSEEPDHPSLRYILTVVFRERPIRGETNDERLLNAVLYHGNFGEACVVTEDRAKLCRWLTGEESIPNDNWTLSDESSS
jgi:hypothetical protein